MDVAGDQLLACSGFPLDQDGGLGTRDAPQETEDVLHLRAAADDRSRADLRLDLLAQDYVLGPQPLVGARQLRRQPLVLALQLHFLERVAQGHAQVVGLPGLGDVAVHLARVDGCDQVVHLGESGQDDPHQVRVLLLRGFEELDAGHVGHLLVRDDRVDARAPQHVERLAPGLRQVHDVLVHESPLELLQVRRLVVDQQKFVAPGHPL